MLTLGLLLILLLIFLFLGVPVSISIFASSIITFIVSGVSLDTVSIRLMNAIGNYELVAVPLFIFLGSLLNETGMAHRLINFAKTLVGFMRGGLSMVNVVTGMFLAEMSGAGTADAAVLAKIFVPTMEKEGYPRGFSAAVTCAASSLAIIIPPSIPMILLGIYADISVAKLFLAAIIPGFLLVIIILILCYVLALKHKFPKTASFSFKSILIELKEVWFVLLIPIVILGSAFSGLATITESAEIGVLLALIGGFAYRKLNIRSLFTILRDSINTTSVILLIVTGSALISWIFANERVGEDLVNVITTLHLSKGLTLLIIAVFLIILGTFLHSTATIIIIGPTLIPLMNALGVDLFQYAMILVLAQGIGQMTPPVATVLYTVSSAGEVPVKNILKYLTPFILTYVILLLLVTYIPFLTTFVPMHFGV